MRVQLSSTRVGASRVTAALSLAALACASAAPAAAQQRWEASANTLVYADTDNVQAVTPRLAVGARLDPEGSRVGARALVDVVSAASVDVVSHATNRFLEARTEIGLDAAAAFDGHLASLAYRFSIEPDYESHGIDARWQSRLGTPDSVLAVGYGGTFDTVSRSGASWDAFSAQLMTHRGEVSLTQTLGPETLIRGVYTLTVQDGYLEKPYRYVPLFMGDTPRLTLDTFDAYRLPSRVPENVPDLRVGHAIGARWLQYLEPIRGSLRVDYQLYLDDWALSSHIAHAALRVQATDALEVGGYARLYVQTGASFWQRTYQVASANEVPRYRTLDRDLSPYWSVTGGLRGRLREGEWAGVLDASLMYTHYDDFLLLDERLAIVTQIGLTWTPPL